MYPKMMYPRVQRLKKNPKTKNTNSSSDQVWTFSFTQQRPDEAIITQPSEKTA